MKSVGELQTMLAWAEDRALLRSTPSADPGAKTGARAEHTSALRSLADRSTTAPGLAPMRQTFAARCRDIQATMPFTIQLRRSDEIPFHGEPRHRDYLSVMGGVIPTGRILFSVRQESLNGLHVIEFLKHLIRHIGPRLLVIWDESPIHRRAAVKEFLTSSIGRGVCIEQLPPYASDLNPVEAAWQHLKHVESRNVTCLDLEDLHLELHLAIGQLTRTPLDSNLLLRRGGTGDKPFTSLCNAQ